MGDQRDVETMFRAFFPPNRDKAVSLELPSGWFGGRPFENQHELTFVARRPHGLLVELDEQVSLFFLEPGSVTREGGRLVVEDFARLVVARLGYGDMTPDVDVFDHGSVTFHSGG